MFNSKQYITSYGYNAKIYVNNGVLWVENQKESRPLESMEIIDSAHITDHLGDEAAKEILLKATYVRLLQASDKKYSAHLHLRLLGGGNCTSAPAPLRAIKAVMAGDLGTLMALLDAGEPIETRDSNGNTLLIIAAGCMNSEICRFLISRGANVHAKNKYDSAALNSAALSSKGIEIVKMLIVAGVNVNHQDSVGNTALNTSASYGHIEIVKTLLAAGANVDHQDSHGQTALISAALPGHIEIVKTLLAAGANVNYQDSNGQTALMVAAWAGHLEVIKALLKAGAMLEVKDKVEQSTALSRACGHGHLEVAKLLLSAGADLNTQNYTNETPLQLAKNGNHHAIVTLLSSSVVKTDARIAFNPALFEKILSQMARKIAQQLFVESEDIAKQTAVQEIIFDYLESSDLVRHANIDLPDDGAHITRRANLIKQLVADLKTKKYLWKSDIDIDDFNEELKTSVTIWNTEITRASEESSRLARIEASLAASGAAGGAGAMPQQSAATAFASSAGKSAGLAVGKAIVGALF